MKKQRLIMVVAFVSALLLGGVGVLNAADCDLGTCSLSENSWMWSTEWSFIYNGGADNIKGIALPHENCQDYDSGVDGYNDARGFLEYWQPIANCRLCLRRYNNDIGEWQIACHDGTTYSQSMSCGGGGCFRLRSSEGYYLYSECNLTLDICGATDPDFVWSDAFPADLVYNGAYENLYGLALQPNAEYETSEDLLVDFWDGSNNDLTLMFYDNAADAYVEQTITKQGGGYDLIGRTFNLNTEEAYFLEITADLDLPAAPDYSFAHH